MALSGPVALKYRHPQREGYFKVAAGAKIWRGAALKVTAAGLVSPTSGNAATEKFIGFARGDVDNTGGAAGDVQVQVCQEGIVEITVAGSAASSLGTAVHATADDTFALTGGQVIGTLYQQVSSTTWDVSFKAQALA